LGPPLGGGNDIPEKKIKNKIKWKDPRNSGTPQRAKYHKNNLEGKKKY